MKAILKTAPAEGAEFVTDFPEPTVKDDEILIDVKATSVCGSDREFYRWGAAAQSFNMPMPRVLGHECSGVVAEVGKAVTGFKVGDRVALDSHAPCGACYQCRIGNAHNCLDMRLLAADIDGVFAERVSVPAAMAFHLPEGMTFEVGALLEPAGVAWHAIQRANKQIAGNTVLVSGSGPIGMLLIEFANLMGATEVIGIEPNEFRRQRSAELGATMFGPGQEVLDYVKSKHAHRGGIDVAFEVSGAAAAYPGLFEMVRRNGEIVTIGHCGDPVPVNIATYINKKEVTLHGIYGRLEWSTWEDLTALIAAGRVDLGKLITDRIELGDLGPVIDMLNGQSNKIVMFPGGLGDAGK